MVYLGKTRDYLCPVSAVAAYLVARSRTPGPFLTFASEAPLSRERLVQQDRAALVRSGVDPCNYSGQVSTSEMPQQP